MSELTDKTMVSDMPMSSRRSRRVVTRAAPRWFRRDARGSSSYLAMSFLVSFLIVGSSVVFHAEIAGINYGGDGFDSVRAAVERISIGALPRIGRRCAADQRNADGAD